MPVAHGDLEVVTTKDEEIRYQGRPEASHSHRFTVAIRVGAKRLNAEGYALGFHAVHRLLAEAVARLDGSDLALDPDIGRPSPTAERLGEVLAARRSPPLADLGDTLFSVIVWEGPENRVDLELGEG